MHYGHGYYAQQQQAYETQQTIEHLKKAIDGEYEAIVCYKELIEQSPHAAEKKRIEEIRNDEIKHYQIFSHLYTYLTGRRYEPHHKVECPKDYRLGLKNAFISEQETVDFYHDAADQATNPYVKEAFRRAAFDEQNHAVWFLYMLK